MKPCSPRKKKPSPKTKKSFICPVSLYHDSLRLAEAVVQSGFRPEIIIAVCRGGLPIGVILHEYLTVLGIKTFNLTAHVNSYSGINTKTSPKLNGCKELVDTIKKGSRILVVDDIWDSGETLTVLRQKLGKKTDVIRTAVIYRKTSNKNTKTGPDYFIRNTTRWIVFPHEMQGLSKQELTRKDPFLQKLLKRHSE